MVITFSEDDASAVTATAKLGLPLPRLQLTWVGTDNPCEWRCLYCLLVPVDKYDIRNTDECGFTFATFGATKATFGAPREPVERDGEIMTPFRDGAHASWDSWRLRIPAYAVYGGRCKAIDPKQAEYPGEREGGGA